MNNLKKPVIVGFIFLLTLFLGMLFWQFILDQIIAPFSLVFWLLLRMFVLSIDQKYFWGIIIFIVLVFLYRLLPAGQLAPQAEAPRISNATMQTIETWRSMFTLVGYNNPEAKILKRELIRLLLSLYATKKRTTADFELYEALEKGEIPIPEDIRAFLFVEEPGRTQRSLKEWAKSIGSNLRNWKRRWTGQEAAEYYRMIEEVLSFMETSLEMKK